MNGDTLQSYKSLSNSQIIFSSTLPSSFKEKLVKSMNSKKTKKRLSQNSIFEINEIETKQNFLERISQKIKSLFKKNSQQ